MALLGLLAAGCAELSYYAGSISGHGALLAARQPIGWLVSDPATPERLRDRLEYASSARDFASRALGLPDNGSYRTYVSFSEGDCTSSLGWPPCVHRTSDRERSEVLCTKRRERSELLRTLVHGATKPEPPKIPAINRQAA